MGGRSGHGSPNAARATDGNGVRRPSMSGKNPGEFLNESPKKKFWRPAPNYPLKMQKPLFKIITTAKKIQSLYMLPKSKGIFFMF